MGRAANGIWSGVGSCGGSNNKVGIVREADMEIEEWKWQKLNGIRTKNSLDTMVRKCMQADEMKCNEMKCNWVTGSSLLAQIVSENFLVQISVAFVISICLIANDFKYIKWNVGEKEREWAGDVAKGVRIIG